MEDAVMEREEAVEADAEAVSEAHEDVVNTDVADDTTIDMPIEAAETSETSSAENIETNDADGEADRPVRPMPAVINLDNKKRRTGEKSGGFSIGKALNSVKEAIVLFVFWFAAATVGFVKLAGRTSKKILRGLVAFLGKVASYATAVLKKSAKGLGRGVSRTAKASSEAVSKYSRLISAGTAGVLYFVGHSAWVVFREACVFILYAAASFFTAFFGAVFGWIGKKFRQPILEIWCFIITPVAHAWGALAHAHIRLKKASKKGFLHAVGSALASFWRFLGGLREIGRFAFNYIAPVVSIAFLVSLIRYASTLQYAISVNYNGNDIGTIENEATFKEAETAIQDKVIFMENDQPILVTPTFSVTVINMEEDEKQPFDDIDLLSETMIETGEVNIVYAYGFYMNDELIGVYSEEDMETIRGALNAKLQQYSLPNAVDVRFEYDIEISEGRFIEDALTAPDSALDLINGATEVEAYYSVVKGDSITKICQNLGISREDFELWNPDLADGVSRGDIVTYHYFEPHLNVYTSYYENYDQVIERTTEYVESSRYEQYCEILLQHGSDGYENVTALVTQTNGVETERVVTSRTILEEMVPRRFRVGTKENTYLKDTKIIDTLGTFCWPLGNEKGYISTMPGWRSWDSSNHMALDIAGIPRGTDIYAACDGKVTFAGSYVAYGKLVIIDCGNGYECYYAHCSEIDVREGDRVEKGDVIAHVGMTGSASGNHLHFEMRYNRDRINPLLALGGTGGHEIRQY